MEKLLTRKDIGNILCPGRKDPASLIGWVHSKNKDLFIEGEDYVKLGNQYLYTPDTVELFQIILLEYGYTHRIKKVDVELVKDILANF